MSTFTKQQLLFKIDNELPDDAVISFVSFDTCKVLHFINKPLFQEIYGEEKDRLIKNMGLSANASYILNV